MQTQASEIARIRATIATEYMAARWGLSGLAQGTAQHRVISMRMEHMEAGHQALQTIVGERAIALIAETLDAIPDQPTRHQVPHVLRCELGDTEDTTHLLTLLQGLWTQVDLLSARVGVEAACKLVSAPPTHTEEVIPS